MPDLCQEAPGGDPQNEILTKKDQTTEFRRPGSQSRKEREAQEDVEGEQAEPAVEQRRGKGPGGVLPRRQPRRSDGFPCCQRHALPNLGSNQTLCRETSIYRVMATRTLST